MTQDKSSFYQAHLDRVSRSFAFCIQQLDNPLRNQVALAYLLFRIIDTVEDSQWSDIKKKQNHLQQLMDFINGGTTSGAMKIWVNGFPKDIVEGEVFLLNDSFAIISDLQEFPSDVQNVIKDAALSMCRGMNHFIETSEEGNLVLSSLIDVNRYCFFVASVVGEMLSRLVHIADTQFKVTDDIILKSHQFGLFLQKINILKDQLTDQDLGRHLVPVRDELWNSTLENAKSAFEYINLVPPTSRNYKIFCAWSLYLGLASTHWIQKSWAAKNLETIPRKLTEKLIAEVKSRIDDNKSLMELFKKMLPSVVDVNNMTSPKEMNNEGERWIKLMDKLYHAHLSPDHWRKLGLLLPQTS